MRWRDLAASRAVARGEGCGQIVGAPFAFADMDQRADHRAHLVLQERSRRRGDAHGVAVACDVEAVECLYRRFRLTLGGTERREVVLADQFLRGVVHGAAIERTRHAPGAVLLEREIGAAVADAVEIMPPGRGKTRV